MIIDTSALLSILRSEPTAPAHAQAIENAATRRISAGSFLEAAIVIDASGDPIASRRLDEFLQVAQVLIEPVTAEQARIGREAYRDFGKGTGHPARLNFGDCFAYALAKVSREPLLFSGVDFSRTDVRAALLPEGDEG